MKPIRIEYKFGKLAIANRKQTENKFIYAFFMSRNIFIDFYNTLPCTVCATVLFQSSEPRELGYAGRRKIPKAWFKKNVRIECWQAIGVPM